MTSRNPNSLDNQDQFHAKILPTQTQGGLHWHKPGNEQGNEAIPEFHAQTFPPGTAPPEHTFRPRPEFETPQTSGNREPPPHHPGSTSRDVHNAHGFMKGRPMQGQLHREAEGAHGGTKNKRERNGLEGVGATDRFAGHGLRDT